MVIVVAERSGNATGSFGMDHIFKRDAGEVYAKIIGRMLHGKHILNTTVIAVCDKKI